MRSPSHPALRCGIQDIPAVYTQRKQPAVPSGPLGSTARASRIALFFSRKRKGEAKRKLPADVRKLKNDCEARGKRTRRARFAAAVRQALLSWALRLIRLGSNIFFPCSSLSAIFLSAFSHRPDWATRFSHRPRHGHLVIPHLMRNPEIPAGALTKYIPFTSPFLDPASLCGVTP